MISIKGTKNYLVALESVAMTDIVLNMFIFFFISFSLLYTFSETRMSRIEVKLPKASSVIALEGSEKVILAINKKGEYFINDEKVSRGNLKNALKSRIKDNPEIAVMLKVDSSSRFNSVVTALDVINELNIRKISVAAVKGVSK
ncbi:MAG: biopolymer transporter ExbD [Candidatus Omnitrophica bacterium]|nr:biopolymer transporter ExbD [Candidatus Omnitrophota bacterium]